MADNINFIPANELPLTEAESVEVLCVEDGELKRKAAEGLGGTSYDAVITLSDDGENKTCELTSGTYEALLAKLEAGERPNVRIEGQWSYGEMYNIYADAISAYYSSEEGIISVHTLLLWYDIVFAVNSDGTVSSDW